MCDEKLKYEVFSEIEKISSVKLFEMSLNDKATYDALVARAKEVDDRNAARFLEANKAYKILCDHNFANCLGYSTKKLKNEMFRAAPVRFSSQVIRLQNIINREMLLAKERERLENEERALAKKNGETTRKQAAAVKFLEAHGYMIDASVSPMTAKLGDEVVNLITASDIVSLANEIRFEELTNETSKELSESDSFTDFMGSDECNNCRGWDGESHRCECENRRVGWTKDGDFENMSIYAEAH